MPGDNEGDVAALRSDNDALRAEIAALQLLVAKTASTSAEVPSSPSPSASFVSEQAEPVEMVSVPSSSEEDSENISEVLSPTDSEIVPGFADVSDAVHPLEGKASEGTVDAETRVVPCLVQGCGPVQEGFDKVAAALKEAMERVQQFAAPHMERLEPCIQSWTKPVRERCARIRTQLSDATIYKSELRNLLACVPCGGSPF